MILYKSHDGYAHIVHIVSNSSSSKLFGFGIPSTAIVAEKSTHVKGAFFVVYKVLLVALFFALRA